MKWREAERNFSRQLEFLRRSPRGTRLKELHLPMKTIPVSFLVAGMLLPAMCLAQPPDDPHGPRDDGKDEHHDPARAFLNAWDLADTDHDGFISKAEFEAMPRVKNLSKEKQDSLFSRLDKDNDGKLTREEIGRLVKPHEGRGRLQRLWELDTDKSGGVSFEEFKAGQIFMKLSPERQLELFHRLDTDGDGFITPKDCPQPPFKHREGEPHPKRPDGSPDDDNEGDSKPDHVNRKLDVNGDGALSFEEFRAGPAVKNLTEVQQKARFDALDRNHDQKISPEDFPPPAK